MGFVTRRAKTFRVNEFVRVRAPSTKSLTFQSIDLSDNVVIEGHILPRTICKRHTRYLLNQFCDQDFGKASRLADKYVEPEPNISGARKAQQSVKSFDSRIRFRPRRLIVDVWF